MRKLPTDYRKAASDLARQGWSIEAIARLLDISEKSVRRAIEADERHRGSVHRAAERLEMAS